MNKPRILVVDDEPQIQRFLRPSLTAAGYDVQLASDGAEALKLAATTVPDLVVLDLGLPDMDGKDVITHVRSWSKVPIIVLSARDQETEKIAALDLGADDYVNKPFGIGELTARIRAALRHASQPGGEHSRYIAGEFEIDALEHSVTRSGVPIKLTPKEFDMLLLFARNAGRVLTHRQILIAIWGPAHVEDVAYLRVLIGQLRQKLNLNADVRDVIETEIGIGYRFVPEMS